MTISFDRALGLHASALSLRVDRANILSGNLANSDTPNYKARDINFQDALRSHMGGSMKENSSSHPGYIKNIESADVGRDLMYRIPSQPSIDGNTVEEDAEHAEFMENNMEFQIAFTLLNSKFKGLQKAVRGD